MQAFLLSAGYGERLRPLTNVTPKCLVPINGIPLLEYWYAGLQNAGIEKIFMNSHHLHSEIQKFVVEEKKWSKLTILYEKKLLGSLGSLLNYLDHFQNQKNILVCNSDNLTNFDINKFISFHNSHNLPASIGIFETNTPTQCGIVKFNRDMIIEEYIEKPNSPNSKYANAGIYIFNVSMLRRLKETHSSELRDIGSHLLPMLVNKMRAHEIGEILIDIGTVENYRLANHIVANDPSLFSGTFA
jgi:mannose-1-phosphate guanylyltransferase